MGNCYREKCSVPLREPDPTDPPPGLACCIDDDPLFDDVAPYDPQDQCCTLTGVLPKEPISLTSLRLERCPQIRTKVNWTWPLPPNPPQGYDDCSVPPGLEPKLQAIPFYSGDKDNPAGFSDTDFAQPQGSAPCFVHDACYYNCKADLFGFQVCNAEFAINLANVCLSAAPDHRQPCLVFAGLYAAGVQTAAVFVYPRSQQDACQCC